MLKQQNSIYAFWSISSVLHVDRAAVGIVVCPISNSEEELSIWFETESRLSEIVPAKYFWFLRLINNVK